MKTVLNFKWDSDVYKLQFPSRHKSWTLNKSTYYVIFLIIVLLLCDANLSKMQMRALLWIFYL